MSKIIRVSSETYDQIENIQSILGTTKQDIVKKAVARLTKELFLEQMDVAFKKLKENKEDWKQELEEREEWQSLHDGLRDE